MLRGVVLITGVMAAGKSTVAQALAERLPRAAHVRGDVFRRMIVSGREDYVPGADGEGEAQLRLRYRLSAATADAYAEAGFTAVVQDVVLGEDLTAYVGLVRTRPCTSSSWRRARRRSRHGRPGRAKTGYGAWTVEDLDGALRADDSAARAVAGQLGADGGGDGGGDSRGRERAGCV